MDHIADCSTQLNCLDVEVEGNRLDPSRGRVLLLPVREKSGQPSIEAAEVIEPYVGVTQLLERLADLPRDIFHRSSKYRTTFEGEPSISVSLHEGEKEREGVVDIREEFVKAERSAKGPPRAPDVVPGGGSGRSLFAVLISAARARSRIWSSVPP